MLFIDVVVVDDFMATFTVPLWIFIVAYVTITIINVHAQDSLVLPAKSFPPFVPKDNYLLDCGSNSSATLPGNRAFQPDSTTNEYLSYDGNDIQVSLPSADVSPIYRTANVFVTDATYTFPIASPGWHWIRLHFFALNTTDYDLRTAKFTVETESLVLLHQFELENNTSTVMKEFLVNVTAERYSLRFMPKGNVAFVNAIEFVSAPNSLIADSAALLFPVAQQFELSNSNLETIYRINVGGPVIRTENDTLGREWEPDTGYRNPRGLGQRVSVEAGIIYYPVNGGSPLIAPPLVYASAEELGDSNTRRPNFNVTWKLEVNVHFWYLIRLHFCDIVSRSLNQLYFNVYINDNIAISGLDLSTLTTKLATAYYKDIVVNSSLLSSPSLAIKVSPVVDDQGARNAILNGVEVFKMNNSVGSLDGEYGIDGQKAAERLSSRDTVAAIGFAMMLGALVGLGSMAVKWRKRPQDWRRKSSFSSWLLPLHAGDATFSSNNKAGVGSRQSQFFSSSSEFGRYFPFAELQEATNNWDPKKIIGIGGFGSVYLGEIDEETKVAVKRGNPQSEQGINEFQTEIQLLSKLRHRHLVSLIGYCDENNEMILVYEYMSNGPLRDHLYGKGLPSLSWRQRLNICIGAARGLHYLHTGSAQGIIHRDVKSTNILLDEKFVAKMADFGLSKNASSGTDKNHVSTAVKGSFGYLDPDYFRKQQLTDKSDVYSFGVVLLEVVCARPAINPELPRDQMNLAEYGMKWKQKGLLEKIIDPTLVSQIHPESMKKFSEAAEKCLAEHGADRPTMGDVLWNLEYALQLQEATSLAKAAEEENNSFTEPNSPAVLSPATANPFSHHS